MTSLRWRDRRGRTAARGVLAVGIGWARADPGGLNRYVTEAHEALVADGVPITTLLLGDARGAPEGMQLVGGRSLPGRLLRLWWAAQRRPAATTLVVHFAPHGLLPHLVGRQAGARLVVHFHGPWAAESRAMGEGGLVVAVKHRVERLLYRRAERLVVLSDAFADLLVQDYGVDRRRVEVVVPGVDLQAFSPVGEDERRRLKAALGADPGAPLVVVARRLVPRMGFDVLLEAWRRGEGRLGTLLVVGGGPLEEQLRSALGQLDRAALLGQVPEEVLVQAYRAADLVVVPSTSLEGFGLVVLEALACGTPVVASRLGGMGELLPRLSPELVVPPGDPEALEHAVRRVLAGLGPSRALCRAFVADHGWGVTARVLSRSYGLVPDVARPLPPASR